MRIVLEVSFPDTADRPGVYVAQVLREVEPVVERMIPLIPGILTDRLSGLTKAQWRVIPDQAMMVIDSLVPSPTPADGLTTVLECFGHNFTASTVIIINAVEYPTTFILPENIRTANPVTKRTTPGYWPVSVLDSTDRDVSSNIIAWVFE